MKENTNVTTTVEKGRMTARISGEIDHHSARDVRKKIDDSFADSGALSLALDMSGVRFMDSSGLGLILGRFSKVSAAGGAFCVLDPSESVRRVLDVAGAARLIEIRSSPKKSADPGAK